MNRFRPTLADTIIICMVFAVGLITRAWWQYVPRPIAYAVYTMATAMVLACLLYVAIVRLGRSVRWGWVGR